MSLIPCWFLLLFFTNRFNTSNSELNGAILTLSSVNQTSYLQRKIKHNSVISVLVFQPNQFSVGLRVHKNKQRLSPFRICDLGDSSSPYHFFHHLCTAFICPHSDQNFIIHRMHCTYLGSAVVPSEFTQRVRTPTYSYEYIYVYFIRQFSVCENLSEDKKKT